jgi:hypothetical protein
VLIEEAADCRAIRSGRNNPVLNYLLDTVVCLPTEDRGLLNVVAAAVTNSLR